jgi:hypothetical protein
MLQGVPNGGMRPARRRCVQRTDVLGGQARLGGGGDKQEGGGGGEGLPVVRRAKNVSSNLPTSIG